MDPRFNKIAEHLVKLSVKKQEALQAKKKAKKEKPALPGWAPWAIAGGLGVGAYALARTPLKADPRKYPALRKIQDMAKGNYAHAGVEGYDPKAPWWKKLQRYVEQGPEEAVTREGLIQPRAKPNSKSPRAVFSGYTREVPEGVFDPSLGPVTGGKATAKNYDLAEKTLEDKLTQSQLADKYAPGTMPRTLNLQDFMKSKRLRVRMDNNKNTSADLQRLQAALQKEFKDSGYVMKTRAAREGGDFGSWSAGKFPTDTTNLDKTYKQWRGMRGDYQAHQARYMDKTKRPIARQAYHLEPGYKGRVVDEIPHNNVIVQEKVPLVHYEGEWAKQLEESGHATNREYRVHVVGGKAFPSLAYSRNAPGAGVGLSGDALTEKLDARRAAAWVQKNYVDKLPKNSKYHQLMYGIDVAPVKAPGQYRMMELNPGGQSGLTDIPHHSGHAFHRAFTGRSSVPVAAALGLGVGTAGGLAAIPFSGDQK